MTWEVFYTPHTDDETIAMGGAIARARANDRHVLVVLVTDNYPSTYMRRVWEGRDDLEMQRRLEWVHAMDALGVTEMRTWELNEACVATEPFKMQAEIECRMEAIDDELHPCMHHTVWGMFDIHAEIKAGSLTHGLCANALFRLAIRRQICAALHGVYVYSFPMEERLAPCIIDLTSTELEIKQRALQCYRDGMGFGYRSVPELINAAASDPREFTMNISHSHL